MGQKSRDAMEAARKSLEARKAEALGPSAPPCKNCGAPSKGTILNPQMGFVNVCSPLRCAFEVVGDLSATTTWTPHPPGRYREGV